MARPQISLTADVVVYDPRYGKILVVQRKNEPFKDGWALPGGFVEENETIRVAAHRELLEETGIFAPKNELHHVGTFDDPNRDPRGRVITVAYLWIYDGEQMPVAADDAKAVEWASTVRDLAFDHNQIVMLAMWKASTLDKPIEV